MVQLIESDIQTKEVLDWKGLHLFHFASSSCSQKTRVSLNLKNINWHSHLVDLGASENCTEYYLGINPRGLVPTLVHDGEVHIESNDILTLLDERFPNVRLIPSGMEDQVAVLLHHEDDLHLDLRTLTFRFTQPRGKEPRSKRRSRITGNEGPARFAASVMLIKTLRSSFGKRQQIQGSPTKLSGFPLVGLRQHLKN